MTEAAPTDAVTPMQAALAGLLHDIGKLAQRAHPDEQALRQLYTETGRDLAGTEAAILPMGQHGRPSHRHALWSDFFFVWTEQQRLRWPAGIDGDRVKALAVRHHAPRPSDPGDWIIAEADRLASGLERKPADQQREAEGQAMPGLGARAGAGDFRAVELTALVPRLDIALGALPGASLRHAAGPLTPEAILPRPPAPAGQPHAIRAVWEQWCRGYEGIARHALSPLRFEQALLGLSERLLWAVPSSTVDQPDVSLHDHARAVAGIAAALAAWHGANGAWDVAAVRDRSVPKFRLVALDLSGIQHALFRLADGAGAARILRARSFLMAETVTAALLTLLRQLDLPFSCVLLGAGGKAELLAPALPSLEAGLAAFRDALDDWMVRHWQGDLALNLAAGPPFAARAFADRGRDLPSVRAALAAALEEAKHRPLSGWSGAAGLRGTGIVAAPFDQAEGACGSCGVRPAMAAADGDGARRCRVCSAAYRLGQALPKAEGFALAAAPGDAADDGDAIDALPPPWRLLTRPERGPGAALSVVFDAPEDGIGSAVQRPGAHVPRLTEEDLADPRHRGIAEEHAPGGLRTFAHIANDALEPGPAQAGFQGRALLAVLKADVDRLGLVFSAGLGEDRSPARIAALSRMMDAYFARRLPWLLRTRAAFASTYTVYAGGDDLLLVLPWRFGLPLALALREDFASFAGGNPNLSLSAGLAFVHPQHPLVRAVIEADDALGQAKAAGRDRVGLFGRAFAWDRARSIQELSERLTQALRDGAIPPTFLHRVLGLIRARAAAEAEASPSVGAARWPALWAYARARFAERTKDEARRAQALALLDALLPPVGAGRAPEGGDLAVTFALWRVR